MTATIPDRTDAATGEPGDLPTEAAATEGNAEPPRSLRPVPPTLAPWHDPHPWVGWLLTAALAVLAGFTRFWGLGFPNLKVFDEAYYPVEAQELLRYGYEDNRGYQFIVHPPLGKWLIGWSSDWFGNGLNDAFGWRVAPAVFGTLTVIVLARTVRRMTRSNLFGAVAGLLIALDGLSLVLARTAILDVFLEFFIVAAFGALVLDRDWMRRRLAGLVADGVDLSERVPSLGPRPWRLVAGACIGLACAVKWTGLSFFVLFLIMSLLWDRAAFRAAGAQRPTRVTAYRSLVPALGSVVLMSVVAYLTTYIGWFVGENGFGRHYADDHSASTRLDLLGLHVPFTWAWVPAPIRALGASTLTAYRFHEGLDSGHAYQSNPWSWLVLGRPVNFYYVDHQVGCGGDDCTRQILLIGTPLMWWAFVPMLLWLAWHYVTTRDWRAAAVWVAFLAGWVVWFQDPKRTMFLFYMAPLVPFLIIGVTLGLGQLLGPSLRRTGDRERDARAVRRRRWGIAAIAVYLALVVVDFAWMWPIWTGDLRPQDVWHAHMWLPSWV